ncbi:Ribosomal RNA adenine dimethylase domain-containing protein 1 [Mactra antiquata]
MISVDDENIEILHLFVKHLVSFLENYQWISDAYVSDFFYKRHWERLPKSWQQILPSLSTTELSFLLDRQHAPLSKVLPLSLLSFKKCCDTFSFVRNCCDDIEGEIQTVLMKRKHEAENKDDFTAAPQCDKIQSDHTIPLETDGRLHAYFRKHVKPKKQHEIRNLSKVIYLMSKHINCDNLVDVGSGLGHLVRVLSFGYGLKVTSVEAANSHAPKAQKYDKEIDREIKKKKMKQSNEDGGIIQESSSMPSHVTSMIYPNMSASEFIAIVKSQQKDEHIPVDNNQTQQNTERVPVDNNQTQQNTEYVPMDNNQTQQNTEYVPVDNNQTQQNTERVPMDNKQTQQNTEHVPVDMDVSDVSDSNWNFILTGLHACGDLTPTLLHFYVNCDKCVGLASVGCCYMKMSDQSSGNDSVGYPMSEFVSSLHNHQQSYAARELACHFAETYSKRLKECPPHLKIHSFRAALEWLANMLSPRFERTAVQIPCGKSFNMQFERYARLGLSKLGIPEDKLTDNLLHEASSMTERWKDVVAFYTIRLALAPVIETLLLLDRMIFLYEKGHSSSLIPVFDPELSPRNFVLLSWKSNISR